MPGTTLLFDSQGLQPQAAITSSQAHERMLHYPSYSAAHGFSDRHLLLGCATFPGYPLEDCVLENRFLVRTEGKVYNKSGSETLSALKDLCSLFGEPSLLRKKISELIHSWDGEFLILLYDTQHFRLVIFNDSLGRLPVYLAAGGPRLLLAREVKYITPFLATKAFDRFGVMQYLLFGSPLGKATLLEGVSSFPAGATLFFAPGEQLDLNADETPLFKPRNKEERGKDASNSMAQAFLHGLRDRANSLPGLAPVLSLSGGLDSRAVLAGLCRLGHLPHAVTLPGPEVPTAQAVVRRFGVPLTVLATEQAESPEQYLQYAVFKDGLDCHPGLPRLHRFMETLLETCGTLVAYFTGIMGGEITRHYNVTSGLPSTTAVARHLLRTKAYYKYSSERVCELLGLTPGEMLDVMVSLLESFSQTVPSEKYLAFRHEFYRRYTGEAEDRNRYYSWTISPFYSLAFYKLAMSLEERSKGLRLWRDVLRHIDPRACADPYFNHGISMQNEFSMTLFTGLEQLLRIAPIKRAAQGLLYLAMSLRTRHRNPPSAALQQRLFEMLNAMQPGRPFTLKAPRVMGAERDTLGLERMQILCSYAVASRIGPSPS